MTMTDPRSLAGNGLDAWHLPYTHFEVAPSEVPVPDAGGFASRVPWWQPIEGILTGWESCDGGSPERCRGIGHGDHTNWECVLIDKRNDPWYPDVRFSLMEAGFTRPLTVYRSGFSGDLEFGDGHHRLAASIELGWTHIPVHFCVAGCSHPLSGYRR